MPLIYSSFIIILFFPFIICSSDPKVEHVKDIYFEVLEPSDISYTFRSRLAKSFGTNFDRFHKNIYLIPTKPLQACSRVQNRFELQGNIALLQRGECSFVTKVINAQETGALGVLVMNNDPTSDDFFIEMIDDLTQRNIQIPAMSLQYRDGHLILNSIEKNNLIGAKINIPLNLTYNEVLKSQRAPGSLWL